MSEPPRLATLLRTLWYIRPRQWVAQAAHVFRSGNRPLRNPGSPPALLFEAPVDSVLDAPAHVHCEGILRLTLINREADFREGIDWEIEAHGPLWRYQLHQFDWLRSVQLTAIERASVIDDWIARHRSGTGWDSGPISLRTFNWVKLLAKPGALPADEALRLRILASLGDQLSTLDANRETRLLANHYLWNLLALVFAGVALESASADSWRNHHRELRRELDEQFPPDGAHFERSPMYHSLLVENVLDLLNVVVALPERAPPDLEAFLRAKLARMLAALDVWTHPDGELAQFGDCARGFAAFPARLREAAEQLGVTPFSQGKPGALDQAGFARLSAGSFVLIASASPPSPSYQPGHAHSDALSFELSVAGQRVVTDTGVYEYVQGDRRDWARATRAHATVVVNGAEQSELWSAHRAGGRPDAALLRADPPESAIAVCAGFATPEVLHKREFSVTPERVEIRDHFDVAASRAEFVLPLAPGIVPSLEGSEAVFSVGGGTLRLALPDAAVWRVEEAMAFPEFGQEVARFLLVGAAVHVTLAQWVFRFEPRGGADTALLRRAP